METTTIQTKKGKFEVTPLANGGYQIKGGENGPYFEVKKPIEMIKESPSKIWEVFKLTKKINQPKQLKHITLILIIFNYYNTRTVAIVDLEID